MKLEIDTIGKTVKLLGNYPLKDVIEEIKKIVDDWDEYTLISYEEKWNYYPYYPYYPIGTEQPTITYDTSNWDYVTVEIN